MCFRSFRSVKFTVNIRLCVCVCACADFHSFPNAPHCIFPFKAADSPAKELMFLMQQAEGLGKPTSLNCQASGAP